MEKNVNLIKSIRVSTAALSTIILAIMLIHIISIFFFKVPAGVALFNVAALALFLIVFRFYCSKKNKGYYKQYYQSIISTSIQLMNSEINTMTNFYNYLEIIKFSEKNQSLDTIFAKIGKNVDELKIFATEYEILNQQIINNKMNFKLIDANLSDILAKMEEIRRNFIISLDEFSNCYIKIKEEYNDSNHNMIHVLYSLGTLIPILSDFSSIFNEFSKDLIVEIITRFGEIATYSHQITRKIEESMESIMDEKREDSLLFVTQKVRKLVIDFEAFYSDMNEFKESSENFTGKTTEKLKGIQEVVGSIEQIAETIKVISLNLSIEAVNTGKNLGGFQVLARDLRDFTIRTLKFSNEVKHKVSDVIKTTHSLKEDYEVKIDRIYNLVGEIKTSINSFENVMTLTFGKIKEVIDELKKFSLKIDTEIKDVVGKLQYYDITSQEVMHLGLFLEKIYFNYFNRGMVVDNIGDLLKDEDKYLIRKDILSIIKEVITTFNERKILTKYEKQFGIQVQEDVEVENKAPDAIKGNDDSIILF